MSAPGPPSSPHRAPSQQELIGISAFLLQVRKMSWNAVYLGVSSHQSKFNRNSMAFNPLTLRTSAIAVATGRAGITISAALWTHLPAWPRLAPPAKPRPVLLATGAAEMRRRRRGACAESLGGTWGLARAMSSSVISADEVRACLRAVMEPNLQANVVALDFVRNITVTGAGVSFDLVLNTPACPTKETLKQTCIDAVAALPWVESVDVHLSAEHRARKRDDPKTQVSLRACFACWSSWRTYKLGSIRWVQ